MVHVQRVPSLDEVESLDGAWNTLDQSVPFRSREWLGTWWRCYEAAMTAAGRRVELYTLCVRQGDELVGIAPWYLDRSFAGGNAIRFLGSGEVCSDYLTVLCRPDLQVPVAATLADWLTQAGCASVPSHDRWDYLELADVPSGDKMVELLVDELRGRGANVHQRPSDNTWRIDLPQTLDEYLASLSKSHRKQLRQLRRRLLDTGRAVLRSVEEASQLDAGWRILRQLHQRRLESLGKPGSFQSEPFTRFHRAATDSLFRAGRLRLHWLELDNRPVAAEYHLAGDDVMFVYQGGMDPDALEHEPGRLITLATLERAIADGYRSFDFCRGDEPYKAHWRAKPRGSVTWRITSNRPSARLRHNVWAAGENARRWIKSQWRWSAMALPVPHDASPCGDQREPAAQPNREL